MYTFMPWTIETTAIRKVTPIKTPSRLKKLFSFWLRIVASAIRTASMNGMSGRGGPLGLLVARDPSVLQSDHPLRVGGDFGLVSHDHDRLALAVEPVEH